MPSKGAKYANGNYKAQQKAYNKTKKGLKLRVNANKLNRKLGTYGNGDGRDAAHYRGVLPREDSKVQVKTEQAEQNVNDPSTT